MSQTEFTPEAMEAQGWKRLEPPGFSSTLGPLYLRANDDGREAGFFVGREQCNTNTYTLHGGALLTFSDICLGLAAADALQATNCVTAQLNMQFVAAAREGEFVHGKPELVRQTSQMIFVRGLILANDRTVGGGDAIYKVTRPAE